MGRGGPLPFTTFALVPREANVGLCPENEEDTVVMMDPTSGEDPRDEGEDLSRKEASRSFDGTMECELVDGKDGIDNIPSCSALTLDTGDPFCCFCFLLGDTCGEVLSESRFRFKLNSASSARLLFDLLLDLSGRLSSETFPSSVAGDTDLPGSVDCLGLEFVRAADLLAVESPIQLARCGA